MIIKKPFWIIDHHIISMSKMYNESIFKLIKIWFLTQWFYFKQLYFKKCDLSKGIGGHFINGDGYCMRCKKSIRQLDMEKLLRR